MERRFEGRDKDALAESDSEKVGQCRMDAETCYYYGRLIALKAAYRG